MPLARGPKWEDHFLGLKLDPRYRTVLGPLPPNADLYGPSVGIAQGSNQSDTSSVGGRLLLQTRTALVTNSRCRHGEDPGSSGGYPAYPDVRNRSVRKNAVGESCVFYNDNKYLQTSVGFVGFNDPKNFCEFYYSAPGSKPSTWQICATRDSLQGYFVDTGFTHTPGVPFVLRVQTRFNDGCPVVEAFINDECVAQITDASKIPLDPLAWEWNLYNFPMVGGGFSNSALWADWLYLRQDL